MSDDERSGHNRLDFQIVENVKIVISVELDSRMIGFPELMALEPGSLLELKRPTGENVDIYAGKVLLGNGEILVVESNLAVRVADLVLPQRRKERRDAGTSGSIG